MTETVSVLFVCLGNICRSPTAEGLFRRCVEEAGLADRVRVDSAGTVDFHVGDPPDPRTVAAAARRAADLSGLRARQVSASDFDTFDYVLAMDDSNLRHLRERCPAQRVERLRLFLEFADPPVEEREVPDPYHGGPQGFEYVLDLVEAGARGLLAHLRREHPSLS